MSASQSPARTIPRSLKIGLLAVLSITLAFGAFAVTRAQGESDVTICVANNGSIRMVQSASDCRSNETAQTLGQQGPAGPPGPAGEPGEAGPPGPQGDPGFVTINVSDGGSSYSGPPHIFLHVPGLIGEATANGFEGDLEVLEWSWGIENSVNIGSGSGGAGPGKAIFDSLTLTRNMDSANPGLMQRVANGAHFDEMVLTGVIPGEGGTSIRYVVTMDTVVVTKVELSGVGGAALPTETVALEFGAVTIDYYGIGPDGKPSPAPKSSFSWSRVTNSVPLP
jgi:type VI secretion system secreted protein Hcp